MNAKRRAELSHACRRQAFAPRKAPSRAGARARHGAERRCSAHFASSASCANIDFALYLPMRYEDETRIVRLADTRDGDMAQIEAVVTESEVVFRPRRQLIVTVDDGSDTCQLRFFNFYPSQQSSLQSARRSACGANVRGGFVGRQMSAARPSGPQAPPCRGGFDAGLFDIAAWPSRCCGARSARGSRGPCSRDAPAGVRPHGAWDSA